MSESGKNERKKLKWSPEEIRQKQKEDSKNIMVKPNAKMRNSDWSKCANLVYVLENGEWVDSEVSFCELCKPNTKVCETII